MSRRSTVTLVNQPFGHAGRLGRRDRLALGVDPDGVAERMLSPAGEESTPQVTMTTSHPSLGYEDFIEGYKPGPAPAGGGLSLLRADLARVLGELITLLELDKRGHVAVRLPVSGHMFAVPPMSWSSAP